MSTTQYDKPNKYIDHDTGTTVVDPIRIASWIFPEHADQQHIERLETERRRQGAAAVEMGHRVAEFASPRAVEPYVPSTGDLESQPQFLARSSTGSRRYDGLAHRMDEWAHHEGVRRVDTRPGEYPAVIAMSRQSNPTNALGDIERGEYRTRHQISSRIFDRGGVPVHGLPS